MKDSDGHFMAANALQLKKLGAAREVDIVGKTDYDFFPSHMVDRYLADDQRVMKTGKPILGQTELVANPDGTVDWHQTSKVPLYDSKGNCLGVAGIMIYVDHAGESSIVDKQMQKVMHFINVHYGHSLEVSELSRVANLSMSQLERRFRKTFNQTPSKFLIRYRLTRASHELIQNDSSMSEIALNSGFFDHSHFSREFKKVYGVSPTKYRNKYRS